MVDGGFTCPNRDGTVGWNGCTYCRNDSFAPDYCRSSASITEQLKAGKRFFGQRYKDMEYIAYFQSYSGTYAPVDVLRKKYEEALAVDGVKGLIIGTRPDCLQESVLNLLEALCHKAEVTVEVGIESCQDHVLQRINRGHTFTQASDAIRRVATRGISVGVHIILGLPEESEDEMLQGAALLSQLPIDFIKLHQLQILKGTKMAEEYRSHPEDFVHFPTAEDYAALVRRYKQRLRPDIKIERYVSSAPSDLLIAPKWGLKPYEIKELIDN